MNWPLAASAFGLIFLAELPDKTSAAILVMAGRARPLAVYLGACAAFAVQSAVAVLFGGFLSLLPDKAIHLAAGLGFLAMAVFLWLKKEDDDENAAESRKTSGFLNTAGAAFVLIFLADWGDLTQLATAALAAKSRAPWTVFGAATAALWAASGLTVLVGHYSRRILRPRAIQKAAALAFFAAAVFLMARA
ncbi:MAG TPA: TMEM165/GDT1 family protein [Elusimicrobiota bacterium]|nr:TMEM165/GDT1 family protein [Elusimicrobiota bacterium]